MRLFIAFVTIMALVAVALMPLHIALAYPPANPTRILPDTVYRGETFNVTVTFTAPADNFNSIGLTDNAPDGWNVTVNAAWCTPSAAVTATGNKAEIGWFGEPNVGFDNGTTFTALYKVTVPDYACAGNHTFNGFLEYYIGPAGPYPYNETVIGDSEVEVPVAATPLICCSPKSFSFNATEGGSNPANQTLEISNSGVDTISWTLSDNAGWLSENPTSGSSTGEHDTAAVSVDITGMSAGDYPASITITAAGATNSPQIVPVSLHISLSTSQISFWPESLNFTAVEGGSNPAIKLYIWNSGIGILNWTLSDDAAWLSENPTGGSSTSAHDTVVLLVNTTGMSAGDYSANINITAPGASNSPQVVPVSLHISSPTLEISFNPESLSFTAVEGGSTPANQTLEIWNSGGGTRDWSLGDDAEWLSESPTSGSSTGEHDNVTVVVNIAGMSAGDYSASINITAPGASNSSQVVPVSLHISSSAAPEISCKPESLNFTAGAGGSNETLEVWNSGIGTLNWTLTDDAAWLSENPSSGSSTSADDKTLVTVLVNTAGMSGGDYSANITITAPGASNTPQTVSVSLHMGGAGPPPSPIPAWLSQYWWAIVAGIVVVVLLVSLLRRRRGI